jgi:hypothetical protein
VLLSVAFGAAGATVNGSRFAVESAAKNANGEPRCWNPGKQSQRNSKIGS